MKKLILFTLILSGCTSSESPTTVKGIKEQARSQYYRTCMSAPEKWGYPMSWNSYHSFKMMGGRMSVSPTEFCRMAAMKIVK